MNQDVRVVGDPAGETGAREGGPGGLGPHMAVFRQRLREPRFWVVQALVVLVTVAHLLVEVVEPEGLSAVYFVPATLYFVPVLYASLNFGREGAIPTAIWSGLLAIPNVLFLHSRIERVGELVQIVAMVAIGSLVALRVDREAAARRRAESEEAARRVSQAKYRGLFETAGEAILLLDPAGRIEEANTAAGLLFGRSAAGLAGVEVAELVGPEEAEQLLRFARDRQPFAGELPIRQTDGSTVWLEPVRSESPDLSGGPVVQVLLRDVTERRQREQGLESYAGQMLRAQEDERLRIAREVHDGPLQSLVSLCRQLDALEDLRREGSSDDLSGDTGQARSVAEAIVVELRDLARDLRPSVLDDLGLDAAVRSLVKDVGTRAGIDGRLEIQGRARRPHPDVELALFRITQEALRNVERHAHASYARVTLTYTEQVVTLSVVDDGVGFDTSVGTRPPFDRFGLLGMKERAVWLGGRFRVVSAPGKGARVEASLPMRPGRPGPDVDRVV